MMKFLAFVVFIIVALSAGPWFAIGWVLLIGLIKLIFGR